MSSPNKGPKVVVLLSAATADETFSQPIDVQGYDYLTIYYVGTGTITSGVLVTTEGVVNPITQLPLDPGLTSQIPNSSVTASELTAGACKAVHLPPGAYGYIQVRISTTIGGTLPGVTAILVAH